MNISGVMTDKVDIVHHDNSILGLNFKDAYGNTLGLSSHCGEDVITSSAIHTDFQMNHDKLNLFFGLRNDKTC